MTAQHIIDNFEYSANNIKYFFTEYMWKDYFEDSDSIQEYGQWIWDPGGVADFGEWNFFFHLCDMYEVLKYQYDPDIVEKHYYYSIWHRWDDGEYGINLKHFSLLYKWEWVEEFAKNYHSKLDKQRAYWNSEAWKKKEKEMMKPLFEKFKEDIDKLNFTKEVKETLDILSK